MAARVDDALVDAYLDGRLEGERLAQFEALLRSDPELRGTIESATRSLDLVRKTLAPVEPRGDFEEQVSSKIISITQSNPSLRPASARSGVSGEVLSADSLDARLRDPRGARERKRLWVLAVAAGLLFLGGAAILAAVLLAQLG